MCVSRLSIPLSIPADSGRENVSFYANPVFQRADEIRTTGAFRDEARHCLPVLGDDDAVGIEIVEQRKALLFELRRVHRFHIVILSDRSKQLTVAGGLR